MQFCLECRGLPSVPTLHLTLVVATPAGLWTDDTSRDAFSRQKATTMEAEEAFSKKLCTAQDASTIEPWLNREPWPKAMRVPSFSPREVTWNIPSSSLKRVRVGLFSRVESFAFGDLFNKSLDELVLPPTVKSLFVGNEFNQPIQGLSFPKSLKILTFGMSFNPFRTRL